MKRIQLILISIICLLCSCNENERMVWESNAGIYFVDYDETADSLMYSFRISAQARDTIPMLIKLQGQLLTESKRFKLEVDPSSTAVEGRDYEPLEDYYQFPVGKSTMEVPVYVMNNEYLDAATVSLNLHLVATDELEVALPTSQSVRLLLTNQLIKPVYWDMPLSLYFGEYSKTKHLKCIEVMGHDFPLKEEELATFDKTGYAYWMKAGRIVCSYYAENTVFDENGNQIFPWDPF